MKIIRKKSADLNKENIIVNKNLTKSGLTVLALSVVMGLTGCATQKKGVTDEDAQAQAYVDQQMLKTVKSVDNSLKDLIAITRGDEKPRSQTAPIGSTVAGRSTGMLSKAPLQVSSVTPSGDTQMSRNLIAQKLDAKMNITWNDDAADLLRDISNRIGFSYYTVGSSNGINTKVKINARNETVKTILGRVAEQIDGKADVKVDIAQKTIKLVYR